MLWWALWDFMILHGKGEFNHHWLFWYVYGDGLLQDYDDIPNGHGSNFSHFLIRVLQARHCGYVYQ